MLTSALAIATTSWGILMGLSPTLQIRAVIRQGSSRDVSIGYFVVLLIGFALWAAYGLAIANQPLIVSNSVAFIVCGVTIAVTFRFR